LRLNFDTESPILIIFFILINNFHIFLCFGWIFFFVISSSDVTPVAVWRCFFLISCLNTVFVLIFYLSAVFVLFRFGELFWSKSNVDSMTLVSSTSKFRRHDYCGHINFIISIVGLSLGHSMLLTQVLWPCSQIHSF
jgi:hypothetical protein